MAEDSSVQQLQALAAIPGALRVITNEHAHQGECDTSEFSLEDPKHFVIHDVTQVEESGGGLWQARTAEGDWTVGYPADLLRRLQQAGG